MGSNHRYWNDLKEFGDGYYLSHPSEIIETRMSVDSIIEYEKHTGVLLSLRYLENTENIKKFYHTKAVGVDVKYPKDCTYVDELIESIYHLDNSCIKPQSKVEEVMILEDILSNNLTNKEASFLRNLLKNLHAWNYYMGTTQHIYEITECTSGNLSRYLKSLNGRYLKILRRDFPDKGNIFIQANPVYGWRGSEVFRSVSIKDWMNPTNFRVVC